MKARWEGSCDSSGVEVSELADEGEKGPTSCSKTKVFKRMKSDRKTDTCIKFEGKLHTSSTAQGGGRNFKNKKSIGEIGCWMAEQKQS